VTLDPNAWQTAVSFAGPVRERGAEAVVLAGEYARGKHGTNGRLDIIAIGEGPASRLLRYNGFLVALRWVTVDEVRAAMSDPTAAPSTVVTWQEAICLLDREGVARWMQDEAAAWSWRRLPRPPEQVAADQLTTAAGRVYALAESLESAGYTAAAMHRAELVRELPRIVALHQRLLYLDDVEMAALVAERMGGPWHSALRTALGLRNEPFAAACRGALELYGLAAEAIAPDLAAWQRDVVDSATSLSTNLRLPSATGVAG
jgi:hypothetical protein